jgi:hypothetical protein
MDPNLMQFVPALVLGLLAIIPTVTLLRRGKQYC